MGLLDFLAGTQQSHGRTSIAPEITASALRIRASESENRKMYGRLIQPWQQVASGYYDSAGECRFPAQFYGNGLSRIRLYVGEQQPDGEVEESDNEKAREILSRVRDQGGGRTNMLRTFGQLRFVNGESYLIETKDEDENVWEMVSVNELRVNTGGGGFVRYRAPQLPPENLVNLPDDDFEPIDGQARVIRFWQRHPVFSAWADAPMRSVLDLFYLLASLTAAETAASKSRAANAGILFLATEIAWGEPGAQDDDTQQEPFLRDLTTAMVTAIKDPAEAAAAVPMIVRCDADLIENQRGFAHLKLRDPADQSESELIEKTIRRLAQGLDIPPEIMLGMGDSNHWSAWVVQDDTWQSHLGPAAQGFCEDLTTGYFRDACRVENVPNWENMVVAYDATEVINHPDKGKDADEAFDRGALGFEAYRNAKGFTDDDAPSDEELVTIVAVKAGNVDALTGQDATGMDNPDVPVDDGQDGANQANEVIPGPPPDPDLASSIVAMADLAVERCRELAGSRVRTKAKGCDSCVEKLQDVPNELVASVLGFETASELGIQSPSDLVAGATKTFSRALVRRGVTAEWASRLSELVELHAARTLYQDEAPVLPAGFMEAARRAT